MLSGNRATQDTQQTHLPARSLRAKAEWAPGTMASISRSKVPLYGPPAACRSRGVGVWQLGPHQEAWVCMAPSGMTVRLGGGHQLDTIKNQSSLDTGGRMRLARWREAQGHPTFEQPAPTSPGWSRRPHCSSCHTSSLTSPLHDPASLRASWEQQRLPTAAGLPIKAAWARMRQPR